MSGHALALLTKRRDELLTRQTVKEYLEITEAIEQMTQTNDENEAKVAAHPTVARVQEEDTAA